ncbi:MAG TPA: putative metal-binding motif-containing protein [Polyangiales bacterium]|jgi:hypothetical protein|nr:putative metal-binding motif-containing protein [Polyangiales bacterium]
MRFVLAVDVSVMLVICALGCSLDRKPVSAGLHRDSQGAGSGAAAVGGGGEAGDGASGSNASGFAGTGASNAGTGGIGAAGSGGIPGGAGSGSGGTGGTSAAQCMISGDADLDGFTAVSCGGDDCDDSAPGVSPAGVEVCDAIDNDCNGTVDDGFAQYSCLRQNTIASCTAGKCVITLCSQGYADCDKNADDGCETATNAVPGDCSVIDCAGAKTPDPNDVPPDDGNDCTIEGCKDGMPTSENAVDGTDCAMKKGNGTCMHGQCM